MAASMENKFFCFTVDDNIRFLKELTQNGPRGLFDHPYPAVYRRLHERYGVKVQLNLFYRREGFDLSRMTDRYRAQWEANADWLRLSFHSDAETERPYENAGYDEVFTDVENVHREILRFAGERSLARTTTVHYCLATPEGLRAVAENGVEGLLGLFGTPDAPRVSYGLDADAAARIRAGGIVRRGGMAYAGIDVICNLFSKEELAERVRGLLSRPSVRLMIHEQYFYPDYRRYQPDFGEKLDMTFRALTENGYRSVFFEELI